MIKLYHYSQADIKGYIKPDFFGLNTYSHYSKELSGIKRSYFYLDQNNREYYFNGVKYRYIVKVNKNKLYNLNKDPLKIESNKKIKDTFAYIKKLGYNGLIGSNGYFCVVLFKKVKIYQREKL
jgi:hypothetical protein